MSSPENTTAQLASIGEGETLKYGFMAGDGKTFLHAYETKANYDKAMAFERKHNFPTCWGSLSASGEFVAADPPRTNGESGAHRLSASLHRDERKRAGEAQGVSEFLCRETRPQQPLSERDILDLHTVSAQNDAPELASARGLGRLEPRTVGDLDLSEVIWLNNIRFWRGCPGPFPKEYEEERNRLWREDARAFVASEEKAAAGKETILEPEMVADAGESPMDKARASALDYGATPEWHAECRAKDKAARDNILRLFEAGRSPACFESREARNTASEALRAAKMSHIKAMLLSRSGADFGCDLSMFWIRWTDALGPIPLLPQLPDSIRWNAVGGVFPAVVGSPYCGAFQKIRNFFRGQTYSDEALGGVLDTPSLSGAATEVYLEIERARIYLDRLIAMEGQPPLRFARDQHQAIDKHDVEFAKFLREFQEFELPSPDQIDRAQFYRTR